MENAPTDLVFADANPAVPDSVHAALRIDLIRDVIVDYAMHDGEDVTISNVRSLRLVSKSFLQSTHRVLRQSQEPLFYIYLYKQGFTVGDICSQKHDKLWEFLRLHAPTENESWMTSASAPHCIEISDDFFCQQNHQSFLDYFSKCGNSLIQLTIFFPPNNDSMNAIPLNANVVLPNLQTFMAVMSPGEGAEHDGTIQKNLEIVQRVFDASEQLKELELVCTTKVCLAPHIFANMRLPSSLTKIEINCLNRDTSLEILVNNSLPKLKVLWLTTDAAPFRDGLITSILNNVGATLEFLEVEDINQTRVNKSRTKFQIPLMEKLKKLMINTTYLELDGNLSCLQKRAPVLLQISLTHHTNSMFRKWTDQSCFTSAQSLQVSFVADDYLSNENGNARLDDESDLGNLELQTMESLARAFPNLVTLDIEFHVTGTELSSLVPLLREMRNLQKLRILVEDDGQLENANAWDALLIGVPVEQVAELVKYPGLLEQLQADRASSIRNLSELHTLDLRSTYPHEFPIISAAVFQFAFFRMPKLINLIFRGCFCTCETIREDWEERGRQLSEYGFRQEEDDSSEEDEDSDSPSV